MNKLKTYKKFNEEINFDYFKDLLTGVKTEDDKIAKKILKDIDDIEFSYGGLYPHTLIFDYNGYRFSCISGKCDLYGGDEVEIQSKFLRDLYERGIKKAYDKKDKDHLSKKDKERKELEKETADFIESRGGLDTLLNEFIYSIFHHNKKKSSTNLISKYDWIKNEGGVRYDKEYNRIIISSPYDIARNDIQSIIFNFDDNELEINISYPVYGDYKKLKLTINNGDDWYDVLLSLKSEVIDYYKIKHKSDSNKKKNIFNNL